MHSWQCPDIHLSRVTRNFPVQLIDSWSMQAFLGEYSTSRPTLYSAKKACINPESMSCYGELRVTRLTQNDVQDCQLCIKPDTAITHAGKALHLITIYR